AVEPDEVHAVLYEIHAHPLTDDLGPSLGFRPTLHREAGVDAQRERRHGTAPMCTAAASRASWNHAIRDASISLPASLGRNRFPRARNRRTAPETSDPKPVASAARRAVPIAAESPSRWSTGAPRTSAFRRPRTGSRAPPPPTRSSSSGDPAACRMAIVAVPPRAIPSSTENARAARS